MNSFTAGSFQEFCLDFKLFVSIFENSQITYVPELLSMACSAWMRNSYFEDHLLMAASVNASGKQPPKWKASAEARKGSKKQVRWNIFCFHI